MTLVEVAATRDVLDAEDTLRALLWAAFGDRFTEDDWAHCLGGDHVVATDAGRLVAHAAVVPRTLYAAWRPLRCGYVEGVATAPDRQGEGIGSLVVARAAELVRERYQVGALSTGRPAFYERLGWERWRGASYVLRDAARERTADEDDGILVLRCGPSAELDLTADIACEERPGDDW